MPKQKVLDSTGSAQPLAPEIEKALNKHDKTDYSSLVKQIETEYQLGWWYLKPKMDDWAVGLKLYNNQKRDKDAVGDPLFFTIHQTVLASIYNDRLGVEFLGRDEGDAETAENLNSLAEFDYDEMDKDMLDYEFDWDASFFGHALMMMLEFDRKLKCPVPEVIDPMTWLRDPRAQSVNGDRKGRGAMKFGGREIRLSKLDMDKAGIYFNYNTLKPDTTDSRSLIDQNVMARADAQGLASVNKYDNLSGDNADVRLLEWFTHWKGKKVLVTLADDRKKVVRYTELGRDHFPIIDRLFYPIAHDWDGVSIRDLVEDKQRARAIVQNLALAGIKLGLHPTYLYDTNKIKNRAHLNIDFNKHIPVDGNPAGAIEPVQRQMVKQEVNWILETLDAASQRATATPDIQQGINSQERRTATELNLQTAKVDTRYSLSAKIFGWSERRFWAEWYQSYKDNFKSGIDEKVIRIVGAMGAKWRPLTRENIIANTDPDIKIESTVVSAAKKHNDLEQYRLFLKDVLATDPQNSNVRFALRKIGRLSGFTKEEVEQVLPPNVDEMNAEAENEKLDAGQLVEVQVYDDDFIHFEIHNKVADNPFKFAHIEAHKKAMMLKRVKPEFNIAANANRPQNPAEPAPSPAPQFANMGNMTGGRPMPVSTPQ
jgi:hypothetical protein